MKTNVLNVGPKNVLSIGNTGSRSRFEQDVEATFNNNYFRGRSVLFGERFAEMDQRQSFYECQQHDKKTFDFDGRFWNPRTSNPMLSDGKVPFFIPLRSRRPSAPYRLSKIIVDAFTTLLFGENRFPTLRAEGDAKSEDYAQTLAREGKLSLKMIRARNLGGAMGTVGVSWCFRTGKPIYEVHNAKNLFVHSWEDRDQLIPRHVSEVYPFSKVLWDGKKFARVWFWYRRDWTPEWDILFVPVLYQPNEDPIWTPDMEQSTEHNDGKCHLHWIQNLPTEDIDGLPDYDGLYDVFDSLDVLMSVVMRGATLNLDPTLVLKLDPEMVRHVGIKKGSDNALIVGESGDAHYMELAGSSIDAGTKLIEMVRRSILEAAQCIVPDPHEVAAQGVSSVAIKAMYAPMTGKADILRAQYGEAIERLVEDPMKVMRARTKTQVPVLDITTGEEVMATPALDLPPKVVKEPGEVDPETGEMGEETIVYEPREVGEAEELDLKWPPYFMPTPQDQAQVATTLQTATGGKAFLSKKTAVETAAVAFGVDPNAEWKLVEEGAHKDKQEAKAEGEGMFPGAGGAPGEEEGKGGPPGLPGKPGGGGFKPGGGFPPKGGGGDFKPGGGGFKPGGFGKPKGPPG